MLKSGAFENASSLCYRSLRISGNPILSFNQVHFVCDHTHTHSLSLLSRSQRIDSLRHPRKNTATALNLRRESSRWVCECFEKRPLKSSSSAMISAGAACSIRSFLSLSFSDSPLLSMSKSNSLSGSPVLSDHPEILKKKKFRRW